MTIEKDELLGLFFRLLPAEYHDRATVIMSHLDRTFFSYLKGISIVVVLYSAAITTTMLAAGLPFALPIGITAGLIQLVRSSASSPQLASQLRLPCSQAR